MDLDINDVLVGIHQGTPCVISFTILSKQGMKTIIYISYKIQYITRIIAVRVLCEVCVLPAHCILMDTSIYCNIIYNDLNPPR